MGAPPGNKNAEKHGFYSQSPDALTINDAISGLVDKMERLDGIIASHDEHDAFLVSVFAIYTQASSRLARLLREKRALSGEVSDEFTAAMDLALDEAGKVLGVEL